MHKLRIDLCGVMIKFMIIISMLIGIKDAQTATKTVLSGDCEGVSHRGWHMNPV